MRRSRTIPFKRPLRGVHIGPRCIDGGEYEAPDVAAHAHIEGGRRGGWICARSLTDLRDHLAHELAHLATDRGHDDRWRESVRQLGGRVPAAYRKRPRREAR